MEAVQSFIDVLHNIASQAGKLANAIGINNPLEFIIGAVAVLVVGVGLFAVVKNFAG